ncbi:MAG: membrane protein insertion efficiency factor YidD [Burkholderiales bacterium]
MSRIALAAIALYQYLLSPWLGRHCRFAPSCSAYVREAIVKYGTLKGMVWGIKRILRCHPWHPGGHDPVP